MVSPVGSKPTSPNSNSSTKNRIIQAVLKRRDYDNTETNSDTLQLPSPSDRKYTGIASASASPKNDAQFLKTPVKKIGKMEIVEKDISAGETVSTKSKSSAAEVVRQFDLTKTSIFEKR